MEALVDDKLTRIQLDELLVGRKTFLVNQNIGEALKFQGIKFWEELTCVGYQPDTQRLTALFQIKQQTGYSGPLCSRSSFEHVRFFVDFGSGFQNMGYVSTKVADITDTPASPPHPLTYAVQLHIEDERYRKALSCNLAVIPTVRAVLSWNVVPSTDPNELPAYGNRLDRKIQLKRKSFFNLAELIDHQQIKIKPDLVASLNLDEPIKALSTQNPSFAELFKQNQTANVPAHRTLFSTAAALSQMATLPANTPLFNVGDIAKVGINIKDITDLLLKDPNKADTTFEELMCVGLNTPADTLSAVVKIKRKSGFNGNLCSRGSKEHVAFWADWDNNGTFEHYIGTTSFDAHDIDNIPAEGLDYAVTLPFNVSDRLRPCKVPQTLRIRAVLSWQTLPSTTDPNLLNYWGNRRDTVVQIRPGIGTKGKVASVVTYVGGVPREDIDPTAFLYNYRPTSPTPANNRPWGGAVSFNGIIDRGGFGGDIRYKILFKPASQPDSFYQPVSLHESIRMYDFGTASFSNDVQTSPDGWFVYRQNPAAGLFNVNNYFATWQAGSLPDGAYTIKFLFTDETSTEQQGDVFTMIIHNTPMTVSPTANTAVDTDFTLDLVIDGGDCHSTSTATPDLNGHVRAIHPYFASWELRLEPQSHVHGAAPSPDDRSYNTLGDTGDANGVWTLNTGPLDPCGYTVSCIAKTRVILNSNPGYFPQYGPKAVGFAKLP
ncbi:hypothetical protein HNV11_01855 [Spirosoma taeanense]|uniref:Uncharacterized protein n=1 Tax=Spirosoma taeanense TaxID=2735870 RepID=A0A6M5Y4T6_9BACT|nr:hypothetical protein [Spirosoma taeanense]QJW88211.1 hypothetical protein HNV11_01855 [Spirosoma taeanense]